MHVLINSPIFIVNKNQEGYFKADRVTLTTTTNYLMNVDMNVPPFDNTVRKFLQYQQLQATECEDAITLLGCEAFYDSHFFSASRQHHKCHIDPVEQAESALTSA